MIKLDQQIGPNRDDGHFHQFYSNKIILAPMVRVGTLPMRILALRFGADLVYSEEIIDFKLIKSRRFVNFELNTVDYIDESGMVVFRTCAEENKHVIIQIGTNDADRAVKAAKMVEDDVAGIDINMGCPKSFSLKGGMGASLLERPDQIKNILTNLKANLRKPISCKIRVLKDLNETLNLVKLIEKTGVDALTVHGRTKDERPQHSNRNDYIREIVSLIEIPVIANGGSSNIECFNDLDKFKQLTNADSVMVARAAMKNCSIFNKNGQIVTVYELISMYLKLAIEFDNNAINTKYCIQQILGNLQETEKGKQFLGSYDLESMSKVFDLYEFYLQALRERTERKNVSHCYSIDISNAESNKENFIELPVVFDKNLFTNDNLPKNILNRWITQNNLEKPSLRTYQIEKQFHSELFFMNKYYSTPYLEKAKRYAEQSAALVLVIALGLFNDSKVIDRCVVTDQNRVEALQHHENGKNFLIKINK